MTIVLDPTYESEEAREIRARLEATALEEARHDLMYELLAQLEADRAQWAAEVPITPCPVAWCDQAKNGHAWLCTDPGVYSRDHEHQSPIDGVQLFCWETYGEGVHTLAIDVQPSSDVDNFDDRDTVISPARARQLAVELVRLADIAEGVESRTAARR